ncbi:MAG: DUF4838 domain-containing protein, partial [Planctomycetales bacterium]|nr:DUF4838 domain-containing protein [Planctomycetales bacterium]
PKLAAAVSDLKETLRHATGVEFATSLDDESRGIYVRRTDSSDVPEHIGRQVPEGSGEACAVVPDGDSRLWIVGSTDLGLCHGIYLYLEQLGCRWYFPSERWTIVPQRNDIRLSRPLSARPAFRSRVFAGTGGFGGNLPLDPERRLQQRWTDWQRRNRFGGEFQVSGHTGEAFNLKYRTQLEAHAEWRAMIDGKRVPWSITAKFCAGNPEVVSLYVQDRVESYRQRRERDPEDPHAWAVSVEPADGGGHCTAPESIAIGSVSDRVFHVANQVARAVRQDFPDGRVSLFAYNEHAAVPNIALEPNVYVQVIPYAFQRTGLSPDQLLDAWSEKVPAMGVYDYWSIPDWSHDLPSFDPIKFGPNRLRGWHRRGVDSFLCESTYSSGAMGPAWYLGSRLAWQPEADEKQLFDQFLRDCFGRAEAPMRRMLTRWSERFTLTSHELALSYRDLQSAWRLAADDPNIAARVADYGRYVIYLQLYFEYHQTKRGSEQRQAAAEQLMRYMWSIYDSSMIHAFRLSQLLARDERTAGNDGLATAFNWQDAKASGWDAIPDNTDKEIRTLVERGVAAFQPREFTSRRFHGELIPLPLNRVGGNSETDSSDEQSPAMWLSNSLEFHIFADRAESFRPRIASERALQLLVTATDGTTVASQSIETGPQWRDQWTVVDVHLPKPGLYHVRIISQRRTFRLSVPQGTRLSLPGWSNSQGTPTPRLYFYVPSETERLAIYANYTAAGPPRFFDPSGVEVQPEQVDGGHLLLIPIPHEQRGRVWSLDRAKCPLGPLEMLNVPEAFAFSPETLLVPSDAIDGR